MDKYRFPASEVRPIAEAQVAVMRPPCEEIEIAGSLRRGRSEVGDIEIVARPRLLVLRDLFGQQVGEESGLDPILEQLVRDGRLIRYDKDGLRLKTFWVGGVPKLKLDLFIVRPPAQWGVILAIRTGPAVFSHRLVTKRHHGGLLPSHLAVRDGAVWDGARLVPTPTEEELFRVLGLEWLPAEERG